MGRHSSPEAAGAGPRLAWVAVIGAVVAAALIWFGQQLLIDAGDITFQEAQEPWAETKAAGPADMERFTAAKDAYTDTEGSCADDAGDAVDADELQACIDRSEALASVATRGDQVNQDWNDHLEQMEAKADTPADAYYEWWIEVVEEAPEAMEPYDDAVDALEDSPSCTLSR